MFRYYRHGYSLRTTKGGNMGHCKPRGKDEPLTQRHTEDSWDAAHIRDAAQFCALMRATRSETLVCGPMSPRPKQKPDLWAQKKRTAQGGVVPRGNWVVSGEMPASLVAVPEIGYAFLRGFYMPVQSECCHPKTYIVRRHSNNLAEAPCDSGRRCLSRMFGLATRPAVRPEGELNGVRYLARSSRTRPTPSATK